VIRNQQGTHEGSRERGSEGARAQTSKRVGERESARERKREIKSHRERVCVHTCMRERGEESERLMRHKKNVSRGERARASDTISEK